MMSHGENYSCGNENSMRMKKIIAVLFGSMLCVSAWAVMASPEPFEYTKADGTKVMARVYGDEFHSYIESLDGELLSGDRSVQAMEQAAQMRRMRRIQQGAGNAAFSPFGSPRSLVLLVSFSDLDFGESLQDFKDLLNKSGYNHTGATGSCRDYYIASSDSLFSPQFDCFGPYKLPQTVAYYGKNEGKSNSDNAALMVAQACQMAHEDGVNFKNYDINNDGVLDNVFVFFAGHNEAEGADDYTIWPHQSNISYMNVRLDGVQVASYACTSEYKGRSGRTRCGVGTFCHEFGHVIGQPDFYDTEYNYYSVGNWDIMCQGSYNNGGNTPPTFSAYERMYEGWLKPKQLTLPGQYTLTDIPFHKEAFLIAAGTHNLSGTSPNPGEFFLLDYRSGANGWDAALPGLGMIIWHIDYSASAWSNNSPNNGPTIMRMHLEEANGIGWKKRTNSENGRPSDVYPGSQNVTSFTPTLHNGTQLTQQQIFNIKENGGIINFIYISDGGASLRTDVESLELTTTVGDDKKIATWEPQSFNVLGTGLDPEKALTLSTSGAFTLYAGDEAPARTASAWRRAITLRAQNDSTLEQRVWVSFSPAVKNCEAVKSAVSISSENASISVPLTGLAPRPTLVKTPEIVGTKDITPYSFTASWLNQDDAEEFYLTLYQVEDGQTDFKQSFEDFSDYAKIREQGWQSNTNLTTQNFKPDGQRSLQFAKYGDQVTSETYPSPVTKLSFKYDAFASSLATDTLGVLEIEAYNHGVWEMMDRIVVTKKSKSKTAEYEFEEGKDIRAFRMTWLNNGQNFSMALDAFIATISQKINYIRKGKDLKLSAFVYGDTVSYTFGELEPATRYFYQVQTTDLDKGCEEHLTELSAPVEVNTIAGKPFDSKQLTIAYDSINYQPAQHAVYVSAPENGDCLYFYNTAGELVYSTPVRYGEYIYPLDLSRFLPGEIYIIQHAVSGKLGRKNKWAKFVF